MSQWLMGGDLLCHCKC